MQQRRTILKTTTPYQPTSPPQLEGFSFVNYGKILNEGFTDASCNITDPACQQQLMTSGSQYYLQFQNLANSLHNVSTSAGVYDQQYDYLMSNPMYAYSGTVLGPPSSIQDALTDDLHQVTLQENTFYVLGTITIATLFIGAIILSK